MKVYYSVKNCGDGSAYPKFFQDEKVAEYHQEVWEEESWGEDCTGSLEIEGDNIIVPEAISATEFLIEATDYIDEYNIDKIKGFIATFFPEGLPTFTVATLDEHYYGVYVDGDLVGKRFQYPGNTTELGRLQALVKIESLSDIRVDDDD